MFIVITVKKVALKYKPFAFRVYLRQEGHILIGVYLFIYL